MHAGSGYRPQSQRFEHWKKINTDLNYLQPGMRVREAPETMDKQLSGTAGPQDLTSSDRKTVRIGDDRIKNRTKVRT